jgi:hypothetical protein
MWENTSKTLFKKITKAKRAGGVAQAVEHLPSKCKVWSSNPGTIKKKKEREREMKQ